MSEQNYHELLHARADARNTIDSINKVKPMPPGSDPPEAGAPKADPLPPSPTVQFDKMTGVPLIKENTNRLKMDERVTIPEPMDMPVADSKLVDPKLYTALPFEGDDDTI